MKVMMEEILERECDEPADWQDNSILERDGRGNVLEVIAPDDEDGEEDVANN